MLCIALSACGSQLKGTTNLSIIEIDGFHIGDKVTDFDLEKYTPSTRFPDAEGTYNFEELRIETIDDKLTKITANLGEIAITISGQNCPMNIKDVQSLLGSDVKDTWYDREQHLRQVQYKDNQNKLVCNFVYENGDQQIVWVILEKQD